MSGSRVGCFSSRILAMVWIRMLLSITMSTTTQRREVKALTLEVAVFKGLQVLSERRYWLITVLDCGTLL